METAWRVAVLAVLVWIALELHGNPMRDFNELTHHAGSVGTEEPAPGSGGIWFDDTATARAIAALPPASSASR